MDGITASLLKEAGVAPANTAPAAGWQIPPSVQAGRDTEARKIVSRETTGGGIPTAAVVQGSAPAAAPSTAAPPATPEKLDPITQSLLREADAVPVNAKPMPDNLPEQIPGILPVMQPRGDKPPEPPTDKFLRGPLEAATSVATGAAAAPIAQVGGIIKAVTGGEFGTDKGVRMGQERARDILDSLTYRPRTESGKEILGSVGDVMSASKLQGLGPTEGMAISGFLSQPMAAKWIRPDKAAQPSATGMASAGSAAADIPAQARAIAANASPEMRVVVEKAKGNVSLDTLKRHVEADTLPVPIQLTKGQATQDVSLLSNEQNMRGKTPQVAKLYNEQNGKLIDNANAIREAAAPDVFATTKPAIGEIPINTYLAKDAALRADVSAKYAALKEANGGQFPLDVKAFAQNTEAALKKELKTRFVPPELRATISDIVKEGKMSFEDFEALRTITSRIQRSPSADGNARAAAGIIRDQLENMPMPKGAESLKPLADAARTAAKSRFDVIKSDPAFKAVVDGKASADRFIDRYVIGADTKSVEKMIANLADDPVAQQAVRAGIIAQLKENAGVINNVGNFSQAGYNKLLAKIDPKIAVIFDAEQKKQLETLGNVARWTQFQPRGSFVNNSNTAVTLMAEGAKNAAEGAANVAAHGLPIGTYGRKIISGMRERKAVNEALQTGAGIELRRVGKR